MAEQFTNLERDWDLQAHEANKSPQLSRYIIIKWSKIKYKEKILGENIFFLYKRTATRLSVEILQGRSEGNDTISQSTKREKLPTSNTLPSKPVLHK